MKVLLDKFSDNKAFTVSAWNVSETKNPAIWFDK